MKVTYNDILIRDATVEDALQLSLWWNDGKIMAHAGFPNGLGTTAETVKKQIEAQNTGNRSKNYRHIIIYKDIPIGEMAYHHLDDKTCEIGIKICDFSMQNKGLGKVILSLFINNLFTECGYEKIILDTNLKNERAQHVYEQLGFKKVRINRDCWVDQLGEPQTSIDYELTKEMFVNFI